MLINTENTTFQKCSSVEIPDSFYNRMTTGCSEVDLMFGSEYFPGFMPGSTISMTGTPGAGKSSCLIQVLQMLADQGHTVAVASGEESHVQIAYTCKRLGVTDIDIAHCSNVEEIAAAMPNYKIMVVDSFQALRSSNTDMKKREFSQYSQDLLINTAKATGCVLVFVLHITTQGLPKGGTDIIHAVDVNMKITVDANEPTFRVIDVYKNRFGETKRHSAVMGSKGFDFQGVYVPPVEEKTKGKSVGDERKDKILEMNEPPHITLDRVMSTLGVQGQTATNLLRELVGAGKLQKFGRGASACWKLVQDLKEIYTENTNESNTIILSSSTGDR